MSTAFKPIFAFTLEHGTNHVSHEFLLLVDNLYVRINELVRQRKEMLSRQLARHVAYDGVGGLRNTSWGVICDNKNSQLILRGPVFNETPRQ